MNSFKEQNSFDWLNDRQLLLAKNDQSGQTSVEVLKTADNFFSSIQIGNFLGSSQEMPIFGPHTITLCSIKALLIFALSASMISPAKNPTKRALETCN